MLWKELLLTGLKEDGWPWDWTSMGLGARARRSVKARIISKSDGVWAASGLSTAINHVARELGAEIVSQCFVADGEALRPGKLVCEWRGAASLVLALERPFLNLASYVSGIATSTHRLVEQVRRACPSRPPRVTATRKTLPHYRDLAVHGVQCGGGFSHRLGLSAGVLIKENHIASAQGIGPAINGVRARAPHGLKLEIEVTSGKELKQALEAGAEAVLLDNFSPSEVRSAIRVVELTKKRPLIEVSGGLNETNIGDYAIEGVDILSVGSLTHSIRAVDLSLLIGG
ncbi:MAG: nicotinate-nucleotide diphosphorylase (carboxylating) [Bdellovibrionales bacterium RIFOXYC1_FULL_54_43]|nr:MAG: nicotinate-nucleotide diphosphorylase (carboxylating) [Bdellovibrionales bacterium RIFOXYC1_FULL_54_43]OFZ84850.1 MAG: nicotinate-nucleotide diphosphorylase (carboxylating) [Bdellovibrionales bacterium RIFOXYD1_FULL_55_31]